MSLFFCIRVPEYEIASTKLLIVQNCQKNEGMILKYEGFFSQFYAIINSIIYSNQESTVHWIEQTMKIFLLVFLYFNIMKSIV